MDTAKKWFLVEYDRHQHKLSNLTEYAEPERRKEAYRHLTELEESQADELQRFVKTGVPLRMEYVLLLADSVDTLRITHGNYFDGPDITDDEIAKLNRRKRDSLLTEAVAD
jgi:hypothetical protein